MYLWRYSTQIEWLDVSWQRLQYRGVVFEEALNFMKLKAFVKSYAFYLKSFVFTYFTKKLFMENNNI